MKDWYNSKVLWFNVVMTVVMAVPIIAAAYKALSPEQAVLIDAVGGLVAGLGNIFLRVWFTEVPIDTPKARAKQEARAMMIRSTFVMDDE